MASAINANDIVAKPNTSTCCGLNLVSAMVKKIRPTTMQSTAHLSNQLYRLPIISMEPIITGISLHDLNMLNVG